MSIPKEEGSLLVIGAGMLPDASETVRREKEPADTGTAPEPPFQSSIRSAEVQHWPPAYCFPREGPVVIYLSNLGKLCFLQWQNSAQSKTVAFHMGLHKNAVST